MACSFQVRCRAWLIYGGAIQRNVVTLVPSSLSYLSLAAGQLMREVPAVGYGPGDQGAINQFYENSVVKAKLSQEFNAKPYFPALESAFIVHFHGPKPADFLTFLETGNCTFGEMCDTGAKKSFCFYALEWASHVKDEEIGQRLYAACKVLAQVGDLQGKIYTDQPSSKSDAGTDLPTVLAKLG